MPEAGRDLSQRLTSLPGLATPAEAGGAGWLAQQPRAEIFIFYDRRF